MRTLIWAVTVVVSLSGVSCTLVAGDDAPDTVIALERGALDRWGKGDPKGYYEIMALLGGVHRLYGPVLGVVPLALLFEYLVARFPNHFSIMVGLVFIVIVYLIPRGIAGLVEGAVRKPA